MVVIDEGQTRVFALRDKRAVGFNDEQASVVAKATIVNLSRINSDGATGFDGVVIECGDMHERTFLSLRIGYVVA